MRFRPFLHPVFAFTLLCAGCASVPPGPPPDVRRLQGELDRLHADRRISDNAGAELDNADAAVALLARNARTLDTHAYQQGVYISDKLVAIAEASALARAAEEEGQRLGAERERLLTPYAASRVSMVQADDDLHARSSGPPPKANAELMALQKRLDGLESRVDERGLVVRVGDFMFQPGQAALISTGESALDSLVRALRDEPGALLSIEGHGSDDEASLARSATVRDYLRARGAGLARVVKPVGSVERWPAMEQSGAHVDVVVRIEE